MRFYKNPNAPPDYSFGSEDWRLRYDYDLTISELFRDHFIRQAKWMKQEDVPQ